MPEHTLCPIDDIPENGCKGFNLLDTCIETTGLEATVFVVRQQNNLYVYLNHCPHLGLPLEWMPDQFLDRDGHYIQCATHGALFSINNGKCVAGPCLGESLTKVPFKIEGKSIIIDPVHLEVISLEKK